MKLTERSRKWMDTVVANCRENTGRTLDQWTALAKKEKVRDTKAARLWAKGQGLSMVYANAVAETLFPPHAGEDDDLVAAQYSGPKAALRPVYEALVEAVRGFGDDVSVMPRKSQVTCARGTTFAVLRAGTRDRVDVALKLHGTKATRRLVVSAGAMASDPSHVVAVRAVDEVDRELLGWLRAAYEKAAPSSRGTR